MNQKIYAMNHSPKTQESPDTDRVSNYIVAIREYRARFGASAYSALSAKHKDNDDLYTAMIAELNGRDLGSRVTITGGEVVELDQPATTSAEEIYPF